MAGKVCMVTTVHQPFDTRIFHKEAKTLAKAGYEVTLIAQNNKNEEVDGIKIIALANCKNRFNRIFSLSWKALKLALHQNCDIYHFHDPELIFIGVILKLFNKKVIYDVHEDLPKQVIYKKWLGNNFFKVILSFLINVIEKICSIFFDYIITVTEHIAERFPKGKTVVIRNFPILELIDNIKQYSYNKERPIVIYAGGLTSIRGIKEIIKAMGFKGNKAELWLLGKWQSEKLKKECEMLKGWENTQYLGFFSLNKVLSYMKLADIGVCIMHPAENYINGLPVKAFEYMACSLPIIMSDFYSEHKTFSKCALFAKPNNPKDIADKIMFLLNHSDKRGRLGDRGRELIEEEYSWESESKKLLKMYNSFNNEYVLISSSVYT